MTTLHSPVPQPKGRTLSWLELFGRNKRILRLRREGKTYRAIGKEVGLTTERIRQILFHLIRQANHPSHRDLRPADRALMLRPFDAENLPPDETVDRLMAEKQERQQGHEANKLRMRRKRNVS